MSRIAPAADRIADLTIPMIGIVPPLRPFSHGRVRQTVGDNACPRALSAESVHDGRLANDSYQRRFSSIKSRLAIRGSLDLTHGYVGLRSVRVVARTPSDGVGCVEDAVGGVQVIKTGRANIPE